jgi:hypothetical protein
MNLAFDLYNFVVYTARICDEIMHNRVDDVVEIPSICATIHLYHLHVKAGVWEVSPEMDRDILILSNYVEQRVSCLSNNFDHTAPLTLMEVGGGSPPKSIALTAPEIDRSSGLSGD